MTSVARLNSVGVHVDDPREHGRHRIVYPCVQRPEAVFDRLGGGLDLIGERHVGGHDERLAAELLNLAAGFVEALLTARHQPDVGTALGERVRDRAPDATRSPGHNHNLRLLAVPHRSLLVSFASSDRATS